MMFDHFKEDFVALIYWSENTLKYFRGLLCPSEETEESISREIDIVKIFLVPGTKILSNA
jgi:hypothetical protein